MFQDISWKSFELTRRVTFSNAGLVTATDRNGAVTAGEDIVRQLIELSDTLKSLDVDATIEASVAPRLFGMIDSELIQYARSGANQGAPTSVIQIGEITLRPKQ